MKIAGIDEAGRGPVIGPMVLAVVIAHEDVIEKKKKKGVQDSKKLSRKQREKLFKEITNTAVTYHPFIISVERMDRQSLTTLLLHTIHEIGKRFSADQWILDAVGHPRLNARVRSLFALWNGCHKEDIMIEPSADRKYTIVSAASIVAKVTRDRLIQKLWTEYGHFGWGYPSEKATRSFIQNWYQEHNTLPPIVRKRWATVQNILKQFSQTS